MKKLDIVYPIIVEGKYDRLRLLSVVNGLIIATDGFSIFKSAEKAALLRALAKASPLIVLTDSDGGGRVIRSHISSLIPRESLIQLYTPAIKGKEKRKREPSREGNLGVEGMERDLLFELLLPFSTEQAESAGADRIKRIAKNPLSMTDLFCDGLAGAENSAAARDALAAKFGLPPAMSAKALLCALRAICDYDEYLSAVGRRANG